MATTGLATVLGTLPASGTSYGLLEVMRPLVLDTAQEESWPGHGLAFLQRPCRGGYRSNTDGCTDTDHTADVVPAVDCDDWIEQRPFRVYDVMDTSSFDWKTMDVETMLTERMRYIQSNLFAQELIDGVGSSGVSLSGTATAPTDVAFGTATGLTRAVAVMENELALRLMGRQGVIHMTPGMLLQAAMPCGLEEDEATGVWTTPNDTIVVADSGYVNALGPTGNTASAAGTDWIYGSGEIFYASTTPELLGTFTDSFSFTRNQVRRFIEGYGLLAFDACPVTAILANYATT